MQKYQFPKCVIMSGFCRLGHIYFVLISEITDTPEKIGLGHVHAVYCEGSDTCVQDL